MTNRLVWLASYPKSGNTWVRAILTALSVNSSETLDINELVGRGGPISPDEFEDIMGLNWSELPVHERRLLLPDFTKELANQARGIMYRKTHMNFGFSPSKKPIFHNQAGAVAIYIARDPRQVAISHANFFGTSLDDSIITMNDPQRRVAIGNPEVSESVGRWTDHVTGWLSQKTIPTCVVQYESLKADPVATVRKMLAFINIDAAEKTVEAAIEMARFDRLQALEREHGFKERSTATDTFFRNGTSAEWRSVLTTEQRLSIERDQNAAMRMLGYLTD